MLRVHSLLQTRGERAQPSAGTEQTSLLASFGGRTQRSSIGWRRTRGWPAGKKRYQIWNLGLRSLFCCILLDLAKFLEFSGRYTDLRQLSKFSTNVNSDKFCENLGKKWHSLTKIQKKLKFTSQEIRKIHQIITILWCNTQWTLTSEPCKTVQILQTLKDAAEWI